jgi:ATP-dependent Clp protease ATP-binding subunit ClpC
MSGRPVGAQERSKLDRRKPGASSSYQGQPMYIRVSDSAQIVMQRAEQEARQWKHDYIGTEHILLGLLNGGPGMAVTILTDLSFDTQRIVRDVQAIILAGSDPVPTDKLSMTPRAKQVVHYAAEEAQILNHDQVGTPHFLLGLLREREGVAAQVLMNCGVDLETLRAEIAKRWDGRD